MDYSLSSLAYTAAYLAGYMETAFRHGKDCSFCSARVLLAYSLASLSALEESRLRMCELMLDYSLSS